MCHPTVLGLSTQLVSCLTLNLQSSLGCVERKGACERRRKRRKSERQGGREGEEKRKRRRKKRESESQGEEKRERRRGKEEKRVRRRG